MIYSNRLTRRIITSKLHYIFAVANRETEKPCWLSSLPGQVSMRRTPKEIQVRDDNMQLVETSPALHVVANKGLVSMMKHLLDHGADVNAVNSEGKSPLHLCVEYGSVQGVKALLEKKATHTQVVRDAAAQKGIKEIEKLLSAAEESKI